MLIKLDVATDNFRKDTTELSFDFFLLARRILGENLATTSKFW